jgi:hypothetical protein
MSDGIVEARFSRCAIGAFVTALLAFGVLFALLILTILFLLPLVHARIGHAYSTKQAEGGHWPRTVDGTNPIVEIRSRVPKGLDQGSANGSQRRKKGFF